MMIELQDAAQIAMQFHGVSADRVVRTAVALIGACDTLKLEPPEVFRNLIAGLDPAAAVLFSSSPEDDTDEIRALYQALREKDADPEDQAKYMARLRELQLAEAGQRMAAYAAAHQETPV